jgi:hypothetical protein
VVRVKGFEPLTTWFVARYSIQLSYTRIVYNINGFNIIKPLKTKKLT